MDKVVFVKGPVENTIPATLPESISLLRLDTDWYSSTKHEIEHLYPRLSMHGVCFSTITGTTREHSGRLMNILIGLEASIPQSHRLFVPGRNKVPLMMCGWGSACSNGHAGTDTMLVHALAGMVANRFSETDTFHTQSLHDHCSNILFRHSVLQRGDNVEATVGSIREAMGR